MEEIFSNSPEETQIFAKKVVTKLMSDERERGTATIIALKGNLGAGKTVFVKGVAELLGVAETVTSPTYVIVKKYLLPEASPWREVVHIDAYRLEGEKDLMFIDWNGLATNPYNLILLEWPEQVGLGVPERAVWIEIEAVDEERRKIQYSNIDLQEEE
jgi:tRNA threonylcarbamoyladenosine biosynthesis protein TsaE